MTEPTSKCTRRGWKTQPGTSWPHKGVSPTRAPAAPWVPSSLGLELGPLLGWAGLTRFCPATALLRPSHTRVASLGTWHLVLHKGLQLLRPTMKGSTPRAPKRVPNPNRGPRPSWGSHRSEPLWESRPQAVASGSSTPLSPGRGRGPGGARDMQSTSHRQDLGSGSGQDQREGSLKTRREITH